MKCGSVFLRRLGAAGVVLLGVVISLGQLSCGDSSEAAATITIGVPPLEQNALLYVAEDRDFFERNGLKVVFKDYDTGVATLNALLSGEVDVAELAEYPFIRAAFERQPVRIITVNDRFENDYLMVRRDRGIDDVADLKGKRIGVIRGTVLEFYLGRFLELNRVSLNDVTIVNTQNSAQTTTAILNAEVDAVVAFQPHVNIIQARLGENVFTWPVQNNQLVYGILVARTEGSAQQDTIRRLLRSLADAEDFLIADPDRAREIVQKRLNLGSVYLTDVWPQHQFRLSLDLSLIIAINDEARWMIDNKLTSETTVPDFKDYVYVDGLKAVKPRAVSITR